MTECVFFDPEAARHLFDDYLKTAREISEQDRQFRLVACGKGGVGFFSSELNSTHSPTSFEHKELGFVKTEACATGLCVASDKKTVVVCDTDGNLHLIDVASMQTVWQQQVTTSGAVMSCPFSFSVAGMKTVCETKVVTTPNLANSLPNRLSVEPNTEREHTT